MTDKQSEPTIANSPPTRRGGFVKGISGNPSGRPKLKGEEREAMELARKYGKRAIRRLAQLMRSKNERVAVAAAQALLDRGFGKPAQAITGAGGAPLIPTSILMGAGPIADAMTAAAAYAAILSDPSIDLSLIEFAQPATAPALIFDTPIAEVEVIEPMAGATAPVETPTVEPEPTALPSAPVELRETTYRENLARLRGLTRKC
jgi:hypothetical protein